MPHSITKPPIPQSLPLQTGTDWGTYEPYIMALEQWNPKTTVDQEQWSLYWADFCRFVDEMIEQEPAVAQLGLLNDAQLRLSEKQKRFQSPIPTETGWQRLFSPIVVCSMIALLLTGTVFFYYSAESIIASSQSTTIQRGPYLQQASTSQITIRWRTSTNQVSTVRYGTDSNNLTGAVTEATSRSAHIVTITGLEPNTKYYYAIEDGNGVLTEGETYFFKTHPTADSTDPMRIWVIGDSGTADSGAEAVRDSYLSVNDGSFSDVWLMLGDNAYQVGTDNEYQKAVFDMYPTILRNTTVWPTIGNHDFYSLDTASERGPYYDMFTLPTNGESGGVPSNTESYYSFDYGQVHFVVLDSIGTDLSADGAMANWLRKDLEANESEWLIGMWHHPPYSKGSHDSDVEIELIKMRENFLPILEDHGVDLVLSGHSHSYERSMLIDGHYGSSDTFTEDMVKDHGDSHAHEDGHTHDHFEKEAAPHDGAIYVVAGNSGKVKSAPLNHPIMEEGLVILGSLLIDIEENMLNLRFIDEQQEVQDVFQIEHIPSAMGNVPAIETIPTRGEDSNAGTVSSTITNINDDVEESKENGFVYLDSSDIELIRGEDSDQFIGLRFNSLAVPQGATIGNAYLTFVTNEPSDETTNLRISAQNTDQATAFTSDAYNVSSRPQTTASVTWTVPAWSNIGETHQSPNIAPVIQEIINRDGWVSGNSIAILIDGTGKRTADSSMTPASSPMLTIDYNVPSEANIDLVKSVFRTTDLDQNNTFSVGDVLAYEFFIWNNGVGTINNIYLTDNLLENITTIECLEHSIPATLREGEYMYCYADYTVTQADEDRGFVKNEATVTAIAADSTLLMDTDIETTPHQSGSSLLLNKDLEKHIDTDKDNKLSEGDELHYSFSILNNGNTSISNITLEDTQIDRETMQCDRELSSTLHANEYILCSAQTTLKQTDILTDDVPNITKVSGDTTGTEDVDSASVGIISPNAVTISSQRTVVQQPIMLIVVGLTSGCCASFYLRKRQL